MTCKYCDLPRKPRHDRPGKYFTLCAEHYADYQRQKNRESYARHADARVQRSRDYRKSNPEKCKAGWEAYIAKPENAARKRQYMRTYGRPWREHVKGACERCGWQASDPCQLDVHHRDRDKSNNDPSNLETLCPPCHRAHHAAVTAA